MKQRRIFIAINLPENIKRDLMKYRHALRPSDLEIRWLKPENLHITLLFLGYLDENALLKVIEAVKTAAYNFKSFIIKLNQIVYGPTGISRPRMVWLIGEDQKQLNLLKEKLEEEILNRGVKFHRENRLFKIHITLARFIQPLPLSILPKLTQKINYSFEVRSLEVMESELKREGAEYAILESIPLSKSNPKFQI